MANGQLGKMAQESESPKDILAVSTKLKNSENTGRAESKNSSIKRTPAAIQKDSKKTLSSAELSALKSTAGLVAAVMADWQTAKGKMSRSEVTYTLPSGCKCRALKLILFVPDYDIVAVKTPDGLTFDLQSAGLPDDSGVLLIADGEVIGQVGQTEPSGGCLQEEKDEKNKV